MAPIQYYNQSGPFWDFVSSLERQGASHPIFAGAGQDHDGAEPFGPAFPWSWAPHQYARAFGRGPPPAEHEQEASADMPDASSPPPAEEGEASHSEAAGEKSAAAGSEGAAGRRGHGPHGCGGRRGGPRGGCGARGRGGFPFGPRGGRGFGGPGGPFNLNALAQFFQEQVTGGNRDGADGSRDFKPLIDVFDTESSFIVHVSLPGAKKEDVGVSWDAEKSELSITGVVHRPGDEDFLKTLALDERQVGAFERKVRLGSRANPAQVDVDSISAKLEDGILRIEVPKEDRDYVDVKKVEIE